MPTEKNRHATVGQQKRNSALLLRVLYNNFVFGFYSAQNTNVYPTGTCLGEKKNQSINYQKLGDSFKMSKMFQIKFQGMDDFVCLFILFCFVFIIL